MFENEEWRVVEEFPNYNISNYGRIKHKNRIEARTVALNNKGFPVLVLFAENNPTRYLRQVNVLVARAFLEPPLYDNETAIWHIDGNLQNCNADNLRWDTRSRVLEWNEMHRKMAPSMTTPRVRNNRERITYANAYECGMAEGKLESEIVWRVERQARHTEDPEARYMYVSGGRE